MARHHAWNRRLAILGIFVVVPLLCIGALYSPLFAVHQVEVLGTRTLPIESVRTAASIGEGQPLVDLDTAAVAARVRAMPMVASVQVSRGWPRRVRIRVVERTPRVALAVPGGWVLADGTGRVLARRTVRPDGIPLLRGNDPASASPVTLAVGARLAPGLRDGAALSMVLDPVIAARLAVIESGSGGVRLLLSPTDRDAAADVVYGSVDDGLAKQRALVALIQAGAVRRRASTGIGAGPVVDIRVPDTPTVRTAVLTAQR